MKEISYLLPRGFRFLGFVFTGMGTLFGFVRFYIGHKPEILNRKVFAFFSSYLDDKFFEIIGNQILEEIAGIFLLSGLFMIAFSREKMESKSMDAYRLKAFFITAYVSIIFMILAVIFTFGMAFMYMAILSMGLWMFIYIVSFNIIQYQSKE